MQQGSKVQRIQREIQRQFWSGIDEQSLRTAVDQIWLLLNLELDQQQLTQSALARMIGIAQPRISRWLSQSHRPYFDQFLLLLLPFKSGPQVVKRFHDVLVVDGYRRAAEYVKHNTCSRRKKQSPLFVTYRVCVKTDDGIGSEFRNFEKSITACHTR
ncbi:MAG: hypothetical protein O3A00_06655 [Planctomycetota bacterium]|nr:hypothetical protein [Planctomycetota bacterium]